MQIYSNMCLVKGLLCKIFGQVIFYPNDLPSSAQEWASKISKIFALKRSWVNDYGEKHQSAARITIGYVILIWTY